MADSSLWRVKARGVSLTWRGSEGQGWNRVKNEGYFWKNLRAVVVGRSRWGLSKESEERGRDLEGEWTSWFLKERICFKFFSFETASSRNGSGTHLTRAFMNVRKLWRRCGNLAASSGGGFGAMRRVSSLWLKEDDVGGTKYK